MVVEIHVRLCMAEPDFQGKKMFSKNWENGPKIAQKTEFF